MSQYGKTVIDELIKRLGGVEVVTIRVSGCNSEVIRMVQKYRLKIKIFEGENFEKLNNEVAEYADCLVIVEGGKESGTILLASNFIEKGKSVYCVPGRIFDEGSQATNWLIKEGAIPLINLDNLTHLG